MSVLYLQRRKNSNKKKIPPKENKQSWKRGHTGYASETWGQGGLRWGTMQPEQAKDKIVEPGSHRWKMRPPGQWLNWLNPRTSADSSKRYAANSLSARGLVTAEKLYYKAQYPINLARVVSPRKPLYPFSLKGSTFLGKVVGNMVRFPSRMHEGTFFKEQRRFNSLLA